MLRFEFFSVWITAHTDYAQEIAANLRSLSVVSSDRGKPPSHAVCCRMPVIVTVASLYLDVTNNQQKPTLLRFTIISITYFPGASS